MMDEKIAENFLRLVSDTRKNGVPEMHFRLWRRSPDSVREKYLAAFRADPEAMATTATRSFSFVHSRKYILISSDTTIC